MDSTIAACSALAAGKYRIPPGRLCREARNRWLGPPRRVAADEPHGLLHRPQSSDARKRFPFGPSPDRADWLQVQPVTELDETGFPPPEHQFAPRSETSPLGARSPSAESAVACRHLLATPAIRSRIRR